MLDVQKFFKDIRNKESVILSLEEKCNGVFHKYFTEFAEFTELFIY